jgi:hypothetical protein
MKPHLINNLEQKVFESYEATLMSKLFRDDFAIDNLLIKMRWFLLLGCLTFTVPYDFLLFVSEFINYYTCCVSQSTRIRLQMSQLYSAFPRRFCAICFSVRENVFDRSALLDNSVDKLMYNMSLKTAASQDNGVDSRMYKMSIKTF